MASLDDRATPTDLDEVTSGFGGDWLQTEVSEMTRSWVYSGGSPVNNNITSGLESPQLDSITNKAPPSGKNQLVGNLTPTVEQGISRLETQRSRSSEPALARDDQMLPIGEDLEQSSTAKLKLPTKTNRRSFAQLLSRKSRRAETPPKIERNELSVEKLSNFRSRSDGVLRMKLVFVGNGACGKTCFLLRGSKGVMPEVYLPTVFENYVCDVKVDRFNVEAALWDTAGQEDYDHYRPLSYPDTHAFFICFAIDDPDSLANVQDKWIAEISHFREVSHLKERAPIFLVGFKEDLRHDSKTIGELLKTAQSPVSQEQAEAVQRKIGAVEYFECSAKTGKGVDEIFQTAIRFLLNHKTVGKSKKEGRRSFRSLFF